MLYYLLTTLYVLVCLVLLLVILLQQGKGGDMASAFGGGSSQTAFGARGGATVLSKITDRASRCCSCWARWCWRSSASAGPVRSWAARRRRRHRADRSAEHAPAPTPAAPRRRRRRRRLRPRTTGATTARAGTTAPSRRADDVSERDVAPS